MNNKGLIQITVNRMGNLRATKLTVAKKKQRLGVDLPADQGQKHVEVVQVLVERGDEHRGPFRIAVSAQVQRVNRIAMAGKPRGHVGVAATVFGEAVQQDHGSMRLLTRQPALPV